MDEEPCDVAEAEGIGPLERYGSTNHFVLLGGAFVLGPQPLRLAGTLLLVLVPFAFTAIFMYPYAPSFLIVLHCFILVAMLWFLFRTATTDPGVVARRLTIDNDLPEAIAVELRTDAASETAAVAVVPKQPLFRDGKPPGAASRSHATSLRYCHTCNRYRGPRTFHCSLCGACVEVFDHHCPWVGTCVGAGNYTFFLWFLALLQLLLLTTFVVCAIVPVLDSIDRNVSIAESLFSRMSAMPVIVLAWSMVTGVASTGLFLLHMHLVRTGRTTLEHLRSYYPNLSPFDAGCVLNCCRFFGHFDRAVLTERFAALQARVTRAARDPATMHEVHQSAFSAMYQYDATEDEVEEGDPPTPTHIVRDRFHAIRDRRSSHSDPDSEPDSAPNEAAVHDVGKAAQMGAEGRPLSHHRDPAAASPLSGLNAHDLAASQAAHGPGGQGAVPAVDTIAADADEYSNPSSVPGSAATDTEAPHDEDTRKDQTSVAGIMDEDEEW